jgi:predicted short-subunit dehydrogenase-like oxidoreductase (DUF2520 family)
MDKKQKTKLNIGIIGAGKIAHSITPALIEAGYNVVSVSSNRLKSAWGLADKNRIKNFSNSPSSTVEMCNLIFLSVPDQQLEIAARQISKLPGVKGKLFIHLSGTKNIKAIRALRAKGAVTGGLHILQAFPERKKAKIAGSYASIEASTTATAKKIKDIALDLGTKPFMINGEDKIVLHIMCVFAANFIQSDYYNAFLLYKKIKSKIPKLEDLLFPLSLANLHNIKKDGIKSSLSGPLARKDYETVNEHLDKLFRLGQKDKKYKDVLESYAIHTLNLLAMNKDKLR